MDDKALEVRLVDPILITGAARSGTSLTAAVIDICGAFGGKVNRAGNRNNKRGLYENRQIVNQIVKPYLRAHQWDPMGQHPLPDIPTVWKEASNSLAGKWRNQILKIMGSDGWNGKQAWYYKGAKMCLMWPIWNAAFPGAKWIIVLRETEDIIQSCLRTSFMRAWRDRGGWETWVEQHKIRFDQMREYGLRIREIWPEDLINGYDASFRSAIKWCGLEWRKREVTDHIDPTLWKGWKQKET